MKDWRQGEGSVTSTINVSTRGKHLRKLGSILTSLRTPNCSCKASIWTLETVVLVLTFVPACDAPKEHKSVTHDRHAVLTNSADCICSYLTSLSCSDYTVISRVLRLLRVRLILDHPFRMIHWLQCKVKAPPSPPPSTLFISLETALMHQAWHVGTGSLSWSKV
jgi:hypothetical protein